MRRADRWLPAPTCTLLPTSPCLVALPEEDSSRAHGVFLLNVINSKTHGLGCPSFSSKQMYVTFITETNEEVLLFISDFFSVGLYRNLILYVT